MGKEEDNMRKKMQNIDFMPDKDYCSSTTKSKTRTICVFSK